MAEETVQDRVEALFDEPEVSEEPVVEEITEEPTDEVVDEVVEEPTEDTEESTEEFIESDDDIVEIEFEGQLIEAPKAVAEALMRNKDYTEKTQDVAAQRKELEIQSDNLKRIDSQYKFAVDVQGEAVKVSQLEQQIEQARVYMRDNIDDMSHTDLEKIRIAIDDTRIERDRLIGSIQNKSNEFQQAHEQSLKELTDKSTEVLRQKVPGWDDSNEVKIKDYALSLGIPEQTYQSVVDPVEKLILHKAMQFDALQSGKAAAVKKVVSTPSIKAKSRNPMPEDVKSKLKLRKTLKNPKLSSKAKAREIEKSFGERFG